MSAAASFRVLQFLIRAVSMELDTFFADAATVDMAVDRAML